MKPIAWFLILFGILLMGCERTLPFPDDPLPEQLVANALVKADSNWQVTLTQSVGIDTHITFPIITNGQVQIREVATNEIIDLQHQGNGIYFSKQQLPQAGKTYQLFGQAIDFPTIQAVSTLPNNFSISIPSFQTSEYQQQPNYLFDIKISDDPATANFYLISIQYILEKEEGIHKEPAGHFSFDPNSDNEKVSIDHFNLKYSFLSDQQFNGQRYTTQVGATSSILNQVTMEDRLTAVITVQSIHEDGYLYQRFLTRFENFEDQLFADPIGGYSNIEGGLGIFAGVVERRIVVRLQ